MTKEEHIEEHKHLHDSLDKLLLDFFLHTGKNSYNLSILELINWSYSQISNPEEINVPIN